MPAYTYLTADRSITKEPCILYSVTVSTDGSGPGKVEIYDAHGAEAGCKVATFLTEGNNARHFHYKGLELSRGLYVDIVEKADYVTVEWEPLDRSRGEPEWLSHLKQSTA